MEIKIYFLSVERCEILIILDMFVLIEKFSRMDFSVFLWVLLKTVSLLS
jgi:hypothetical protein